MSAADSNPPPYSSTVDSGDDTYQYSHPPSQIRLDRHLHTQITTFRADHIQEIIARYLLPIVQRRVEKGLSRTSIALLPIDVAPVAPVDTSSFPTDGKNGNGSSAYKVVDIVSSLDNDLQQVQLTDPIDTSAFWSQPAVHRELRRCLKARLTSDTGTVEKAAKTQPVDPPPQPQPQQTQSKSRSFFSRRSSNKSQQKEPSTPDLAKSETISPELVAIDIQPDEVCMRTVNEFGLYQTLTRQAVIVRAIVRG